MPAALVPPTLDAGDDAVAADAASAPLGQLPGPSSSFDSSNAPQSSSLPQLTAHEMSFLAADWVNYPMSGPPVSHISAFMSYAKDVGSNKLLLDAGVLMPATRSLLGMVTSTNARPIVVPLMPGNTTRLPGNTTNPWRRQNLTDPTEIVGAVCSITPDGAGTIWPLSILAILIIALILCDAFDCFGLNLWQAILCRVRGEKPPRSEAPESGSSADAADAMEASPETTGTSGGDGLPSTPTGTADAPQSAPSAGESSKDAKKPSDDSDSAEDPDEAPETIDFNGFMIIGFTIVPALVGDLYFTMMAPFLPGVAHLRGLSSAVVGFIFACQPLGSIFTAPIVPWALKQPWGDPYVLLRRSTAGTALAVSITGLLGKIPMDTGSGGVAAFLIIICLMRFTQGVCVTIMEVCNSSISLMLLPKDYVGPAQGIITATRIFGVICGPVLGGFLYQAGCWALPFTVGGALLFVAVVFLMVGLGRRAPKKLRPNKDSMMSMGQLLGVRDVAWLALPMVMVCMETSLMEPAWQSFLGRPPFHMAPQAIGAFLFYAIVMYMAVLVFGGICIGVLGPAVQYLFGALLSGVGLLFLGPSPLFNNTVPTTEGIVLMGAMINYAGVAFFVPAMVPLALQVFERAGFKQKQVAGVTSSILTLLICSANFVGPPLGGFMIDQFGGVPVTTTVYAIAVVLITSVAAIPLCKYAKRLDKEIANGCKPLPVPGENEHDQESASAEDSKKAE